MIGLTKINSEFEATTMNFQLIETSDQKQPYIAKTTMNWVNKKNKYDANFFTSSTEYNL